MAEREETQPSEAAYRKALEEEIESAERLAAADPDDAEARRRLGRALHAMAVLRWRGADQAEARRLFARSLAIAEPLAAAEPENLGVRRDLSALLDGLGTLASEAGDRTEARRFFARGLEVDEELAAADPEHAWDQRNLGVSFQRVMDLTLELDDEAEARRLFARSLALRERLAATDPAKARTPQDLLPFQDMGSLLLGFGGWARRFGDEAGAQRLFAQGLAFAERLAAAEPANAEARMGLSTILAHLAEVDPLQARARLERALEIARALAAEGGLMAFHAGWPEELARRLAALPPEKDGRSAPS